MEDLGDGDQGRRTTYRTNKQQSFAAPSIDKEHAEECSRNVCGSDNDRHDTTGEFAEARRAEDVVVRIRLH